MNSQQGLRIRAAVLDKQGQALRILDDVEIIEPRAGEVRVQVHFCSLCHSDLSVMSGVMFPLTDPIILGHEAAGVVESVGAGVTHVRPGDHVVLTPTPPCGVCYFCQRSEFSLCVNGQAIFTNALPDGSTGYSRQGKRILRGLGVGGLAEYVVTPATGAVKIPRDLPLDVACLIGCAVQTGVGAVLNTARVVAGATTLITGLGAVGIAVVQGARIAGATTIVASDPIAERRALALQLGATHAIDPRSEDLATVCRDLTHGIGLDYAFETAGHARLIEQCIGLIRPGGTTVCVGSPPMDQSVTIPNVVLFGATGKSLCGCLGGSCNALLDIPRMARLWQAGSLHLEPMVTARRPLTEVNEAFDDLRAGRGLRTVLRIGAA